MEQEYEQREDLISENYQEPQQERVSEGAPNPADYEDYDLYVQALVDHQVRKASEGMADQQIRANPQTLVEVAVRKGLTDALQADRAAIAQAQSQERLAPYNDDPHGAERSELVRLSLEYSKQAIMASESGKTELARTWRERQRQVEKDLERLPPPPEVEFAQKAFEELDSKSVDLLYREDLADHPMWETEKMLNDSAIVVARAIHRAKTTLRLPCEDSPFGNVMPCTPRNMVTVELPPDQMKSLKAMIPRDGDPQTIFLATHRALHKLGFGGAAERAIKSKERAEKETEGKPHKDPDKMTQREFEKWRLSQGAKRY